MGVSHIYRSNGIVEILRFGNVHFSGARSTVAIPPPPAALAGWHISVRTGWSSIGSTSSIVMTSVEVGGLIFMMVVMAPVFGTLTVRRTRMTFAVFIGVTTNWSLQNARKCVGDCHSNRLSDSCIDCLNGRMIVTRVR
jgi:hypothetical protein